MVGYPSVQHTLSRLIYTSPPPWRAGHAILPREQSLLRGNQGLPRNRAMPYQSLCSAGSDQSPTLLHYRCLSPCRYTSNISSLVIHHDILVHLRRVVHSI